MPDLKSFFDNPVIRRRRLVQVTRRAWVRWEAACYALAEARCAFSCDAEAVRTAHDHCTHLQRRYNVLESTLADETNLPKDSVYSAIAAWTPLATRLYGNLPSAVPALPQAA